MKKKIAIIIPAYNEAPVISKVLEELPDMITVGHITYRTLIIVIDDGSTDNTATEVLRRKNVYLINHILNSGAGAATRTGLVFAKQQDCEFATTMDADGQHHVDDVIKIIIAIVQGQADLIIGSRLLNTQGMPWYRVLGNKGLSLLTFLLFGVFVSDSQSGLRALNKTALNKISFRSNNFAFCSEMILKAKQQKLKIKEIPIRAIYTKYSLSKGQSNWGAIHIISQLLKRRLLEFING